jgi:hypothetical protein
LYNPFFKKDLNFEFTEIIAASIINAQIGAAREIHCPFVRRNTFIRRAARWSLVENQRRGNKSAVRITMSIQLDFRSGQVQSAQLK